VARLWKQLHESLGTKLIRSSTYHPQTDGQTERVNQIVEDMLRENIMHFDKSWDKLYITETIFVLIIQTSVLSIMHHPIKR
jgi:hypothetical protein